MTAEAYARLLKQLLPPGKAWEIEQDSVRHKLLLAIADEFARIDARSVDLQAEWDPRTALETLAEWESMLGLPDDCTVKIADTISERRVAIEQKYTSRGGQRRQFYIDLAATLGYVVTITEFPASPLRAGFRAGDKVYGEAWAFAWQVNVPVSAPDARFKAGSRAGDRLGGYGVLDLECIIEHAAPAHTIVMFKYA